MFVEVSNSQTHLWKQWHRGQAKKTTLDLRYASHKLHQQLAEGMVFVSCQMTIPNFKAIWKWDSLLRAAATTRSFEVFVRHHPRSIERNPFSIIRLALTALGIGGFSFQGHRFLGDVPSRRWGGTCFEDRIRSLARFPCGGGRPCWVNVEEREMCKGVKRRVKEVALRSTIYSPRLLFWKSYDANMAIIMGYATEKLFAVDVPDV